MKTRRLSTRSRTTLDHLRRSRSVASATLLTILSSIAGPLIPKTALAQSVPTNPGNSAPSLGSGNTALQAGQSDVSVPETGPGVNVTGSVDTATGAFHASIPFVLPAARGAVQPSLSLDYSSSSGRGVGGLGWSLNLPSIERHSLLSGEPTYQDPPQGERISPQTQDLFTYAGQALVPVCFLPTDYPACVPQTKTTGSTPAEVMPTWAMSGGWHYYRLEVDTGSNLRFFWSGNHRTWVVQAPDGSTQEFGVPQDDQSDGGGIDVDRAATQALTGSSVPLPAIFRYNLVRQYDAQRLPGTTNPTNIIEYKWATLAQPAVPAGSTNIPDPAFVNSLTDIYDTPPVGTFPPMPQSFAHHVHLNYINDPTWLVPNSSPAWKARPIMRLAGVDVTSQTYAGGGQREQIRRYVLSYGWDWNEYDLQMVQLDGWCSTGNPAEDPTTLLLPPEGANPVCGAGPNNTWPPATTFQYDSGTGAYPAPNPTFYKMPNGLYSAGGTLAGAINLPTLVDLNADGLPDVINPALTNGETFALNSVQEPLNSWTGGLISLLHPTAGASPGTMGPWSPNYAAGAFLNDSHVNAAWFDSSWFGTSIHGSTTVGVPYVTYSPVFTSSTSMDWGSPTTQTLASVFPGWQMQNCCSVVGTPPANGDTACADGNIYLGGDQKFTTLDVDGDGFQDLIVSSFYGDGTTTLTDPGGHDQWTGTSTYTSNLNVKFTTRALTGVVSPFSTPLPQETASSTECAHGIPGNSSFNDQPNFCVGGNTDASTTNPNNLLSSPWTFGDLNGDGLPDFVTMYAAAGSPPTNGFLVYYGHGDGVFGGCNPGIASNSVACGCSAAIYPKAIAMPWSPINATYPKWNVQFHDVDGDGLDDAIMPSSDGFDVYINQGGGDFAQASIHVAAAAPLGWTDTSATSPWQTRVYLFADMDGSGVDDVVIADTAGNMGYVDVLGSPRPGLLQSIQTTNLAQTTVQYTDMPSLARAANTAGNPWLTQSAQSQHVVTQMSTTDLTPGILTTNGVPAASAPLTTTYTYRDPMYDGRDRQFIGFTTVDVSNAGGKTNTPPTHVWTNFYKSYCDDSNASTPCPQTADYPNHALRGLPILTETYGGAVTASNEGQVVGPVLSTVHRTFTVTYPYQGLDNRSVHYVWNSTTDAYWYDNSQAVNLSTSQQLVDVYNLSTAEPAITFYVDSNNAHTQVNYYPGDVWGMSFASQDLGQVNATGGSQDGSILTQATYAPVPEDTTDFWIWRPTGTSVSGFTASGAALAPETRSFIYDARGNLTTVQSVLSGVVQMARTTNSASDADAGAPVAPVGNPSSASTNGLVTLAQLTPDPSGSGNVTSIKQPGTGACQYISYDTVYSQLPTSSTTYTNDCAGNALTTAYLDYVRGFGASAVKKGVAPDGEEAEIQYDYLGRPATINRPDPVIPGAVEGFPGVSFTYNDTSVPRTVHKSVTSGAAGATGTTSYDFWTVLDGFGRPILSASPADTSAGDAQAWIVSGQVTRDAKGEITSAFPPSFQANWTTVPIAGSGPARTFQYDAFGRITASADLDGTPVLGRVYGILSYTEEDAEQLKPAGATAPHAGLSSIVEFNGHGRVIALSRLGNGGSLNDNYSYLPAGELWAFDRYGSDSVTGLGYAYERWMEYDSLGRMVLNVEPNATTGFVTVGGNNGGGPIIPPASLKAWTYAYDDAGDLVATTDARGCGKNIGYDSAHRPVWEDYFGCTATQLPYSPPNLTSTTPGITSGSGAEVVYNYDPLGHLTDVYDRGAHTGFGYDARSRLVSVGKNLAQPNAVPTTTSGYAPHTFERAFAYDDFDRIVAQTTGEDPAVSDLNGATVSVGSGTSSSAVTLQYSKRGVVQSIAGSYGALIRQNILDYDGLPLETSWGDVASAPAGSHWQGVPGTQTAQTYDKRRRLSTWTAARAAPTLWNSGTGGYTPPPTPPITTTQTVLEADTYTDDALGNPVAIIDGRISGEWPQAYQPVSRTPMVYDDFYRLKSASYVYGTSGNQYVSPSPAATPAADPLPLQSVGTRIGEETFDHDPLGNPRKSTDDTGLFFDRSLGSVTMGVVGATAAGSVSGPNQVAAASLTGASGGNLTTTYDAAGNLEQLGVVRNGACASPDGCKQLFHYEWDEVGRLAHAQRFDFLPAPVCSGRICPQFVNPKDGNPASYVYPATPPFAPGADVRYSYGTGGARTLRTSLHADGTETYTAEIFSSLRLNDTTFGIQEPSDYDRSPETDGVYLVAGGASLGRVVYVVADPPTPNGGALAGQHVLLELADPLGSTTSVIDQATSELVERTTYTTYGRVESDYWTERWGDFREQYKFTGKEDDVSLGITYFGARYYSPYLGTWISPDPLTIHGLGADPNPYAYVSGHTMNAVDPLGLQCLGSECTSDPGSSAPPGDFTQGPVGSNGGKTWEENLLDQFLGNFNRPAPRPPPPSDPRNMRPLVALFVPGPALSGPVETSIGTIGPAAEAQTLAGTEVATTVLEGSARLGPAGIIAGVSAIVITGAIVGVRNGYADAMFNGVPADESESEGGAPVPAAGGAGARVPTGGRCYVDGNSVDTIDMHHAWPKYLGGAVDQDLIPLNTTVHQQFHAGLDQILPRWRGTDYYQSLTPDQTRQVLIDLATYTQDFDAQFGTSIYQAMLQNGFPSCL